MKNSKYYTFIGKSVCCVHLYEPRINSYNTEAHLTLRIQL